MSIAEDRTNDDDNVHRSPSTSLRGTDELASRPVGKNEEMAEVEGEWDAVKIFLVVTCTSAMMLNVCIYLLRLA